MAGQWEVVTHTAQGPQQRQRGYCPLWQEWTAQPRQEISLANCASAAGCSGGKNCNITVHYITSLITLKASND